jgi:hypothetical protein
VKHIVLLLILGLPVGLRAQTPVQIKYECTPEDVDAFGLNCTEEEPCQVLLELGSVEAIGGRLMVAGNLHTRTTTLFSLLLASDDSGVTWSEPSPRMRYSALEQIQFFDGQNGWVSGESVDPLPRNAFMMLTNDGGRTWRQRPLFEDAKYGTIAQFQFSSPSTGELVLDSSQGKTVRQELYETQTGGESWELKEKSSARLRLSATHATNFHLIADARTGTYKVERGVGKNAETIANFVIHVADCH